MIEKFTEEDIANLYVFHGILPDDIIEPGIHRYKPPQETFNGYKCI